VLDPAFAKDLADLGGFALFLLVVTVAAVGFHKRWIVPGWIYQQERDARQLAETQALRNAEALDKLARAVTRDERKPRRTSPVANAQPVSPHDPD